MVRPTPDLCTDSDALEHQLRRQGNVCSNDMLQYRPSWTCVICNVAWHRRCARIRAVRKRVAPDCPGPGAVAALVAQKGLDASSVVAIA